jgi:hypothetical protein
VTADALQDLGRIGELIALWETAVPDHIEDRNIILAVDAIAFCSLVTITEDNQVRGQKCLKNLRDQRFLD